MGKPFLLPVTVRSVYRILLQEHPHYTGDTAIEYNTRLFFLAPVSKTVSGKIRQISHVKKVKCFISPLLFFKNTGEEQGYYQKNDKKQDDDNRKEKNSEIIYDIGV